MKYAWKMSLKIASWSVLVPRLKDSGKHGLSQLTAASRENGPCWGRSAEGQHLAHLCYLSHLVLAAAHFIFIQMKREGKLRKMEDAMSCRKVQGNFTRPGLVTLGLGCLHL